MSISRILERSVVRDQRLKIKDQLSSGYGAGGVRVAARETVVRAHILRKDHLQWYDVSVKRGISGFIHLLILLGYLECLVYLELLL